MSDEQNRDSSLNITHGAETSRINEIEKCSPDNSPSKFSQRRGIFSNDQEVFIDSQSPLILLNDTNAHTPTPKFANKKLPPVKTKGQHGEYDVLGTKSFENGKNLSFISSEEPNKVKPEGDATRLDAGNTEADTTGPPSPDKVPNKDDEDLDIFGGENKKQEEVLAPWKQKVKNMLENKGFSLWVGIFTIYALFGDDFRVMSTTQYADIYFDVFTLIALASFTVEITFTIISDKKYLWSFFFWLDLISTISLILDLQMFANSVFSSEAGNTAQIARASRASRIGTKAGRVVRVIRLVRLSKLYKQVKVADENKELKKRRQSINLKIHPESNGMEALPPEPTASNDDLKKKEEEEHQEQQQDSEKQQRKSSALDKKDEDGDDDTPDVSIEEHKEKIPVADSKKLKRGSAIKKKKRNVAAESIFSGEDQLKESRVGKKLSDLTTKRVIVIVLVLLLFMPMFDSEFFNDPPPSNQFQAQLLAAIYDTNETLTEKRIFRERYVHSEQLQTPPLVYLRMTDDNNFEFIKEDVEIDTLRKSEKTESYEDTINYGTIYGYTSNRATSVFESQLNLGRTLFICMVLTFGAMIFSHDANKLVLTPIERMIEKVNKIARNPMTAKEEKMVKDKDAGAENETVDIENAIVKIGGLLALGFGDAGSEIVAQNIAMSGDINPMLPGKRKLAIFGFCDIRNFTDATEVLQKDVMIFVNSIGEIVHRVVDKYAGSANKNIGDAFLLVWKVPESQVIVKNKELTLKKSRVIRNLADFALISFLKIYVKINKDRGLMRYRENAELCDRMPNYRVRMGFGLHVGWAIEGAIGSHFKIDASYLSPNVNMASRFEAATKQYGVPLLFSGDLWDHFSKPTKKKCRLIDIITVKGSIQPVRVYTCDVEPSGEFGISKDKTGVTNDERFARQKRKKDEMKHMLEEGKASDLWEDNKELKAAVACQNPEFMNLFKVGFDNYIKGDWDAAKKRFQECQAMDPEDGPTKTVVSYMKSLDFIPPDDWNGYRVLTEK